MKYVATEIENQQFTKNCMKKITQQIWNNIPKLKIIINLRLYRKNEDSYVSKKNTNFTFYTGTQGSTS